MASNNSNQKIHAGHNSKLAALLESAVDSIITIDANGMIEAVNSAVERLFYYTDQELIGQNVNILMPEPFQSEHDDYLKNYRETGTRKIIGIGREVIGRRKDGSTFPMHLSVSEFEVEGAVFFTGIVHDLSERKESEQALLQAQKMEAIGQLTGGIAHDFNNLLTVIIGNLELLDMKLDDDSQRELLTEAAEAADLGARLTDRLLAFARRSYLEPDVVDLNMLVLGLTDMLHRTLGEHIDLSTALSTDLWPAKIDAAQVETAIVNLAVNARDAMPDEGKLVLETRNVQVDEAYSLTEDGLKPGDYVVLSVSDTGSGMPEYVRERVFEPFFTTKELGRGTGLGLSMVYGFAKQSEGNVTIYSEVGVGTTVNLYLPRHLSGVADTEMLKTETAIEPARGELILVVEDDTRVRRLTLKRLNDLGYRTLEAASGAEALIEFKKTDKIDLVFTDLVMPGGMSGYELAAEVRKLRPQVKVLLTSGYAEELTHSDKLIEGSLNLLRKPYRQADLAGSIREELNGK